MSQNLGILLLRVTAGLTMLLAHGWPKLMSFTEKAQAFPDPLGVGPSISLALTVFAEVFCAIAITIGLGTRIAAIPLFICMAVALFVIHGADPFGKQEKALLFMAMYLVIALIGAGDFSIDRFIRQRKKK